LELLINDLYIQIDWKPEGGFNKELDAIILTTGGHAEAEN
jgi:hypothetical protein